MTTLGIARGPSQCGSIDEQPRFLHPYWNNANNWQHADFAALQRTVNFSPSIFYWFPLSVTVHEKHVARIQFDTHCNPLE